MLKTYIENIKHTASRVRLLAKGIRVHEVEFHGKKLSIHSRGRPSVSPQKYVDDNAVICGCCGNMMLPGSKIWLCAPKDTDALDKPGVLRVKVADGKEALAACLGRRCCPTAMLICGELEEGRVITFFESPLEKAINTGEAVCVPDVSSYRG